MKNDSSEIAKRATENRSRKSNSALKERNNSYLYDEDFLYFDSTTVISEKIINTIKLLYLLKNLKSLINTVIFNIEYVKKNIISINEIKLNENEIIDALTESKSSLTEINNYINEISKFYDKTNTSAPILFNIKNAIYESTTFTNKFIKNCLNINIVDGFDFQIYGYKSLFIDSLLTIFQHCINVLEETKLNDNKININILDDDRTVDITISFKFDDFSDISDETSSFFSLKNEDNRCNTSYMIVYDIIKNKHKGDFRITNRDNTEIIISVKIEKNIG